MNRAMTMEWFSSSSNMSTISTFIGICFLFSTVLLDFPSSSTCLASLSMLASFSISSFGEFVGMSHPEY
jgi:hypothetical protein